MKSHLVIAAVILSCLSATPSLAHEDEPKHDCIKPYKPANFNNQEEYNSFRREVDAYKECIEDFAKEQEAAAKVHQDAANAAVDEWNSYLHGELGQ